MNHIKKISQVNNPIIYLFLALGVSSICYGINRELRGLSVFLIVFFFIWIFLMWGINFSFVVCIFFTIGLFINIAYYNVPDYINDEIRIEKISNNETIGSYRGKKIYIKNTKEKLEIGQIYNISGTVSKNDSDKSKGIVGSIKIKDIHKCEEDFKSKLYKIKLNIYRNLKDNLGIRKSGLISSIAFGYSDGLDSSDKNDMKNFGIIHSISVSGLHVAVVYGFLRIFMGNKLGLAVTIIYVIFTGSNYSSIRAFVMLATVVGSDIFKRNNNSVSSLCLSAMILTVYKPYSIFEISFHLSYLATLGIILLNKKINNKLYKFPGKLRSGLSITLSAQVFTTPYLLLIFKDFSLNFIVGNLILIPFINVLVILGNLLFLFYKFQGIFDFISFIVLKIINIFDSVLNNIDRIALPSFYGNEYYAILYLSIIISVYFINNGIPKFKYFPLGALIVIILQVYSPILSIKYYNEGAILVAYRGERVLVSNKKQIDMDRLKEVSEADKVFRGINGINVKNRCKIKVKGKNYVLEVFDKKYLLKMAGGVNETSGYDIINFKDGPFNKIFILNDEVIKTCS